MYQEEDYLQLSGIQHFLFCRRQWALIHLEQQWAENIRTIEGKTLHKNAHDSDKYEKRGDVLIVRALRIHSARLGLSGECDVVEFHEDPEGVSLVDREGRYLPYPVEYKRGIPKKIDCDRAQLCAQAMCLEEMLCCTIPEAALYYGQPRRREVVILTDELRQVVEEAVKEMHLLYLKGYTPKGKYSKACDSCSLKDICLPKMNGKQDVEEYMKLEGELES